MYWSGSEITDLDKNHIFVFGSNPEGRHGAGSAKKAVSWGAQYGNGRGLQGQTYALVTKNLTDGFTEASTGITYHKAGLRSVSRSQIISNIAELYQCCNENPDKTFYVAYTDQGRNLNGYTWQEMYEMLHRFRVPDNLIMHECAKNKYLTSFNDEYRFLSNFWFMDNPLVQNGVTYKTSEHFFMAMKTTDRRERVYIASLTKGGDAKRYCSPKSGNIELRPDWEDIKVDVMEYILKYKFHPDHNPKLHKLLEDTGDMHLQEGNWWNDKIWGVCLKTGEGSNILGKLLMQIREEYR